MIAVWTGPAVGAARSSPPRPICGSRDRRRGCAGPAHQDSTSRYAWLLPDLVGRAAAMDLVLTGRWLEAAEALALGLVNRVCEDPEPPRPRSPPTWPDGVPKPAG